MRFAQLIKVVVDKLHIYKRNIELYINKEKNKLKNYTCLKNFINE